MSHNVYYVKWCIALSTLTLVCFQLPTNEISQNPETFEIIGLTPLLNQLAEIEFHKTTINDSSRKIPPIATI